MRVVLAVILSVQQSEASAALTIGPPWAEPVAAKVDVLGRTLAARAAARCSQGLAAALMLLPGRMACAIPLAPGRFASRPQGIDYAWHDRTAVIIYYAVLAAVTAAAVVVASRRAASGGTLRKIRHEEPSHRRCDAI